jgi:hypothetical protein
MAELYATKEAILAASRRPVRVTIKTLGGDVLIRPLLGREREEVFANIQKLRDLRDPVLDENGNPIIENGMPKTKEHEYSDLELRKVANIPSIAKCLVDANGKELSSEEEIHCFGEPAIKDLSIAVMQVSGLYPEAIGDAEKNSSATQSDASPSA